MIVWPIASSSVRTCAIEKKRFTAVESWLSEQRALWEARTDRLEKFVTRKKGESR